MGGCLAGNNLRNGNSPCMQLKVRIIHYFQIQVPGLCPCTDDTYGEIWIDRGIGSQCESEDDMVSKR